MRDHNNHRSNRYNFWGAPPLGNRFDVGFQVDGFWPAFWGALIVSVVSIVMSLVLREEKEHH